MSRTVLITGSAQRVGKEIAKFLAKEGYNIALHYNKSDLAAKNLAQELLIYKRRVKTYQADLTNAKNCYGLIERVKNEFPDFDVLINSASIFERKDFLEVDEGFLHENFAINFYAAFNLTQQFAKLCKKGDIINISDSKVETNTPAFFAYLLSKKTLSEFSKMSALRLAPDIRVNQISPGTILPNKDTPNESIDGTNHKLPSKKNASPYELCKTLNHILANPHYYGQNFFINGGENLL